MMIEKTDNIDTTEVASESNAEVDAEVDARPYITPNVSKAAFCIMHNVQPRDSRPADDNAWKNVWIFERTPQLRTVLYMYDIEEGDARVVQRFLAARDRALAFARQRRREAGELP